MKEKNPLKIDYSLGSFKPLNKWRNEKEEEREERELEREQGKAFGDGDENIT